MSLCGDAQDFFIALVYVSLYQLFRSGCKVEGCAKEGDGHVNSRRVVFGKRDSQKVVFGNTIKESEYENLVIRLLHCFDLVNKEYSFMLTK